MKRTIYILILSCVFISCKKDKKEQADSPIVGTWIWAKSISFINGDTTTPQSINKSWTLTFHANNTCSQGGTLYNENNGTYNLTTSNGLDYLNINFTNGNPGYYYTFIDGMLKFGSGPSADVSQDFFIRALTF
ncbi:MAG: hypothetical protein ABI402_11490 [Ferruginibacter sp.]